ncbi:cyanophycinase [Candidatus Contubernalis alkaliaceticus]|uniref:cyanophycinase n=1 Tax=Candidatus Contubernalis alkaliaceticus TaxID=338645 RepID=UPI001F4C3812|nr:cyanophycinase [Candidatus Contubernalis alkalaceticus]UNC90691.1 cyanophycinase [Candidatus Contubernalis alkalaceticus]
MGEQVQGNLVIVGGAEDKKKDCIILRRVIGLAGGDSADLAVLTTASEKPEETGESYKLVFKKLGLSEVSIFDISNRQDANNKRIVNELAKKTGIFFTGGDQLRITSILGGTLLGKTLLQMYRLGVVIAGTSAGASVMSDTMIIGGDSDEAPHISTLSLAPGLGFLEESVVDQHFAQRGRIGRLLSVIACNPNILGIGIDEDTAVVVFPRGELEVIGSNSVTILDGTRVEYSNVSELSDGKQSLSITGVTLHALSSGARYSLKDRMPKIIE